VVDAPSVRVAGVEQDRTALAHVGVDAGHGRRRRRGDGRDDRPVDQGEERQFVLRRIDADGIAGLERRAPGEFVGEAQKSGAAGGVDLGVARDDVGEVGLVQRRQGEGVACVIGIGAAAAAE
jgi:hypothetical protein